jgi:hypothetical protein
MKPILGLLLLGTVLGLVGCGKPEPTMPPNEYADKSKMTSIASTAFTQNRNWEQLTPDEKKPFLDFYKEEAKGRAAFDKIVVGLRNFTKPAGG